MHTYTLRAPQVRGKDQPRPIALHSTPTIGTSVPKIGENLVVELIPTHFEPVHYIFATANHS